MHGQLQSRIARLADDLRAGRAERAALFWLKVFCDLASDEGAVRSDRWVEAGLAAAAAHPALDATALAPRRQLVTQYDLFRFTRMKDGAELSGADLESLDWQRRYVVSLRPELADELPELRCQVEALWEALGGAPPELVRLEEALASRAEQGRAGLIEALHDAQAISGGWLPRAAVERVAARLRLPVAEVQGVINFYDLLRDTPVGRKVVRVCADASCQVAGADRVYAGLCSALGVGDGQTTPDGEYTVERARCLGLCDHAPAAQVGDERFGPLDPAAAPQHPAGWPRVGRPTVGGMVRIALANVGVVDPTSLDSYRTEGGMAALRRAVTRLTPAEVIAEVQASRLVGRGGAAFPAGQKWQLTADNPPGPRYVICNADESEPGAFKDRVLLEGDPFRVLEGLLIACYAVGAERGFIYIRGEYRQAYERVVNAVAALEAAGLLGERIFDSDFSCRIEVRRGAGAYICGEETALMESIEGRRGFPRLKPPFPTTAGLWGRPTVINNVETLAKVPPIMLYGGAWYSNLGTAETAGTKLFAVSGTVRRPGVYEVPFGVPLRHLIEDLAGGMRPGRRLQAILTGGAAGTFLTPEHLDVPLSFEGMRAAGGTVGAGTIVVLDDTVDLRAVLASIGDFFAHESCGKCYPCQMGTQRQAEILRRVADGAARPDDLATLEELGAVMTDTSICGLGQTATLATRSAARRWPGLLAPDTIPLLAERSPQEPRP